MFEVSTLHAELTKEQEKHYNLKVHIELFDIVKIKETVLSFETSEGWLELQADVSGVITELYIDDETKKIKNGDKICDIAVLNKNQLRKLNTIKENIIDDNYFGLLLLTDGYDTPNKISKMTFYEFREVFGDEDDLEEYYKIVLENASNYNNIRNTQSSNSYSNKNNNNLTKQVTKPRNFLEKILALDTNKLFIVSFFLTTLVCFVLFLFFGNYKALNFNHDNLSKKTKVEKVTVIKYFCIDQKNKSHTENMFVQTADGVVYGGPVAMTGYPYITEKGHATGGGYEIINRTNESILATAIGIGGDKGYVKMNLLTGLTQIKIAMPINSVWYFQCTEVNRFNGQRLIKKSWSEVKK